MIISRRRIVSATTHAARTRIQRAEPARPPAGAAHARSHVERRTQKGDIDLSGFPYDFPANPLDIRLPPPMLGQHTREILAEVGYTPHEIDGMMERGEVAE